MRPKFFIHTAILLAIIPTCSCSVLMWAIQSSIPDEPWEKYGKVAKEAVINQQYDLAEKNYLRAIEEYKKKEFKDNSSYCYGLSEIYMMQGRYKKAEEARRKYYKIRNEKEVKNLPLIDICLLQGKFDDAQKTSDWILKDVEDELKTAEAAGKEHPGPLANAISRKFWAAYPTVGNCYIPQGNYEKAELYLREHLDYCLNKRFIGQDIAKAKNNLAMAYYYAGDDKAAEKLFREAADLNSGAFVLFEEDLAISLTMLGRIEEHRGSGNTALQAYLSALNALSRKKMHPGLYRVEQADVWNQIGRFQLTQGKPEESAKAYHEAIRLRQATDTQTHPNCADAIKGLADVAAYRNELTSATLQAQETLKILDASVMPSHPRLSIELMALASIDTLAGHPEQAAPLDARLEPILQKPLGPWKEDFLATTAFYAGLLKKAGKTEESARLEQLYTRQKSRR